MKQLFLLGLTISLFMACQNKPQRYFDESPEIETTKAGITAYETQDWDTWKANFADTAKIFHNTNKASTPDESMEGMKQMLSNMESYGFGKEGAEVEMIVDKKGRTWVNYWNTWMGKTKVTNKTLSIPVHLTIQYVDGKIVQEYGYYDTAPIQTAFAEIEAYNVMSTDEKSILKMIDGVVEGWNAHDISNLKSLSEANLVRTTNGNVEINNIDEYEGFMKTFVSAFPDFTVLVDKSDIKGNKVYINWTVTGSNNGEFLGNAPTGKKIRTHGFSVWTLNDAGKFIQEDAYYDNQTLFDQLGIAPPKS
ncbi:ester cyclase [Tamlana flava]|uniref:ester cyclase n=1 Tax=Tamlana flava TaxID=3158572 RepID=UPI00351BC30C